MARFADPPASAVKHNQNSGAARAWATACLHKSRDTTTFPPSFDFYNLRAENDAEAAKIKTLRADVEALKAAHH